MLPNDNVLMSVGHLDHVLIVYSSMEHVTWKSPGPMCGWVGRILHPDSGTSVSSWSKVPLFIHLVCRCASLSTTFAFCQSMTWFCSTLMKNRQTAVKQRPRHGLLWLTCELHCFPLPWRLGSVYQLWKSLLLSCDPWSSDRTSCLSLQHMSWSRSCKGHDRSIRSIGRRILPTQPHTGPGDFRVDILGPNRNIFYFNSVWDPLSATMRMCLYAWRLRSTGFKRWIHVLDGWRTSRDGEACSTVGCTWQAGHRWRRMRM